ncbi:MAG: hypothetical protein J7J52_01020, partial [Deltaproteobacteria bacterium]|nr:hypothetical protein [Deltaproteobacteria bacterium]
HLNPASVEFAEDLPAAGRCKIARVQTYYEQVLATARRQNILATNWKIQPGFSARFCVFSRHFFRIPIK